MESRLKIYKMLTSILLKFLTLKWNILRTIWPIEAGDGSFICMFHALSFGLNFFRPEVPFKGQLQRFHKLISNDRIWPSEHGFEVIFEKSLFVFQISAFKVRNKRGIHSRFHSFSENNNRETFVCDVISDQSSMIY